MADLLSPDAALVKEARKHAASHCPCERCECFRKLATRIEELTAELALTEARRICAEVLLSNLRASRQRELSATWRNGKYYGERSGTIQAAEETVMSADLAALDEQEL